jgi:hypothetical protein
MLLTFDADHVLKLLELSERAESRWPSLEQLVVADFWREDLASERRAVLDAELKEKGFAFSARNSDVDGRRVPPGLILVGDQGVYLMSNAPMEHVIQTLKPQGLKHVAYAAEANPDTLSFDEWWSAKRRSFGRDDGAEFLAAESLRPHLRPGGRFHLDVTPESICVIGVPPSAPGGPEA